jgi:hypothetical protein
MKSPLLRVFSERRYWLDLPAGAELPLRELGLDRKNSLRNVMSPSRAVGVAPPTSPSSPRYSRTSASMAGDARLHGHPKPASLQIAAVIAPRWLGGRWRSVINTLTHSDCDDPIDLDLLRASSRPRAQWFAT